MKNIIDLKRKDGINLKAELKVLDESYITKIMELQEYIEKSLNDKELYVSSTKDEFIEYIQGKGKVIGYFTLDSDELIALGVYRKLGYEKENYGYDLGIEGEKLLEIGQVEVTIVREDFRGNKLQKILCEILEKIALNNKISIMTATVSPYNKFSLNTFESIGYKVGKDKLKYGGLRRYVLIKYLH
ncbi:GNAT family N-acetyltransferase [Clostridium botulinum]|uniref:GNAT family N-acetyltransferase n=1 Tax=unclassified Clostridium TaxID=2614128 RepID=UPI0002D8BED6|nr:MULTISPECIES: GNAT family N-acetyltransferase [unclassified Clostridium]MBN1053126.1 GNAT family N-acetyltransferase [Clostridium botulinum]